jgi:predicted Zn-dependent protease
MRADCRDLRFDLRLVMLVGLSLAAAIGLAAQSTAPAAVPPSPAATQPQSESGTSGAGTSSITTAQKPALGTTPVGDDVPAPPSTKPSAPGSTSVKDNQENAVSPDKVVGVGSELTKVKQGGIDDVSAVGTRSIGGRGLGNWYSTDSEIKMGKQYADQIDKSVRFITDPVVEEYVNRIGQNIVKNSDCKVPFTIKVIDSDEVNAFALPGGFFYVNSGLILAADEEAELAGVMAHETAHVCAHHAAREMTRAKYAQIGMVPMIMMTGYSLTGYGIYDVAQLVIPISFLEFSREFEGQADFLGIQYMYRAGYDPQAMISFFEKVQALEKRKPGLVSKAFSDHPQTPDRILHSQEEIARILPAKDEYLVTTSEFDDVKTRLARIENKRRLVDTKAAQKPSLRRTSTGNQGGQTNNGSSNPTDRPTLHRRDEQN